MSPLFKNYFDNSVSYQGGKSRPVNTEKKTYKLSSNENMLGNSPLVKKAISNCLDGLYEYPPPSDIVLREKISSFLGDPYSADQILTGNGGVNIIHVIVQAFLDSGLECIVPYPSFIPYFGMPTQMGAIIKKVPLKGPDYSLDIEAILKNVTPQTRVLWLASPNNPIGNIITQLELDTIMEAIPDHVLVVYDEVYHHYVTESNYARPTKHILKGRPILALNSFSKAYGLAGLRIGYAYTTIEVASYIRNFMRPFYINQLSQQAAMAALDDQEFVTKVVTLTNNEKIYLYKAFDDLGLQYWKSEANFILVKPTIPIQEFESKLAEQGIMVRSAAAFEAPNHIRITIGDRESNDALIRAIENITF